MTLHLLPHCHAHYSQHSPDIYGIAKIAAALMIIGEGVASQSRSAILHIAFLPLLLCLTQGEKSMRSATKARHTLAERNIVTAHHMQTREMHTLYFFYIHTIPIQED